MPETVNVTPVINSFSWTGTYTVVTGTPFNLVVSQLPNPLDEGIPPGYPVVAFYDDTAK